MLKKLDIVSIRVENWRGAVDWYRDVLGLRPAALHDDPWCLMTLPEGEAAIALDGTNPTAPASSRATKATGWPRYAIRKGIRSTCTTTSGSGLG